MNDHAPALVTLPPLLRKLRRFDFPRKLGICERLFGAAISPCGVCWVETAAALAWKLDLSNSMHRWIVYGQYQGSAFLNWARKFLPRDGVVVDSGANIGQMLLYLAQYVPEGKLLAFEPGKEAGDWLEECLRVNPRLPVELLRCGLGETKAELFLQAKGDRNHYGSDNQISYTEGDRVAIVRLEDILAEKNVRTVSLWKLDVEGHEVPALRGAESLLKEQRIRAIYAELGFGNGQRIVDYLAGFSYRCHLFGRGGRLFHPTRLPQHTDGLFLPVA